MLVVMKRDASKEEIAGVVSRIGELGLTAVSLPGAERTAIGTFGAAAREFEEQLESMPGEEEIVYVSRPFKLASREVRPAGTVGEGGEQAVATALAVRDAGATLLRGGAYKPSTSPYAFRGLGEPGLAILEEARAATGLPIVTEVLTPA